MPSSGAEGRSVYNGPPLASRTAPHGHRRGLLERKVSMDQRLGLYVC